MPHPWPMWRRVLWLLGRWLESLGHWFRHLCGWQPCEPMERIDDDGDLWVNHRCVECGEEYEWWNLSAAVRAHDPERIAGMGAP